MRKILPGLKIIKPGRSELVHRVYSPVAGRYSMALGLLVPFALQPPGHEAEIEFTSIWEHAASALPEGDILDEGWPKPMGEFLAAGHCYPPAGHTGQPVSAHVAVGPLSKQLAVFGHRSATLAGGPAAPEPFHSMRISHANAFGGAGHEYNAEGKGVPEAGSEMVFPNIELPAHLMTSASDRPPVAGFGPLPAHWPQRASHLGKQDPHWRDTRWPHLPEDSDGRYFMAAAADQRLQEGYWSGGEAIVVQNMHPRFPQLEGQVPQSRPRFFVHQSETDEDARFRELHVHVDTIWLLPEAQLGIMIFRGILPVHDPDGRDVNAFYAAFEDPAEPPLPIETYAQSCLKALAPELFQEVPDTASPEFQETMASTSTAELLEEVRKRRDYFQDSMQKAGLREAELLEMLQANPHTRQFAQAVSERHTTLGGFFNEIEQLLQLLGEEDSGPGAAPAPQPSLNDILTPYPHPAASAVREAPAHAQTDPLHDAAAAVRNRQMVVNAIANGYSCADLDLTHANLAGLDLGGMVFNGAVLAGANLAGAQLQGADLTGAYAVGARFDAANLAGSRLVGASLGGASFVGATLRGANLSASDCSEANFSGADLTSATLKAATLSHAWLQGVRAERLIASDARFDHANLDNAQLPAAHLENADLSGASAQRINLEEAVATRINLSQTDLSGANLVHAQLGGSQTGPGTSLEKSRLDHAFLEHAGWMSANLNEASLVQVQAQGADFSDTVLSKARLSKADLRNCSFDRAVLEGADLGASNLMEASFIHSHLQHCNFDHCNLYNATFKEPYIAGASFRHANLDRTLLATS